MEIEWIVAIILAAFFPLLLGVAIYQILFAKRLRHEPFEIDHKALKLAEVTLAVEGKRDWVVVKRCHGPAYTHSAMAELVGAIAVGGVEATYDVVGTSSADGGITNYLLKVIRGTESEALEILARLEDGSSS